MRLCIALLLLISLITLCRLTVPSPADPHPAAFTYPTRPNTPFERMLRQAWKLRSRALLAEIHEREMFETLDPRIAAGAEEDLRREALARDPSGDLRRARQTAHAASALARVPAESRRAAALLMMIDRELDPSWRVGAGHGRPGPELFTSGAP